MTFPDKTLLEALWDGPLGDTITRYTYSEGSPNDYGTKVKTWTNVGTTRGRIAAMEPDEKLRGYGYELQGDAKALVKLAFTITEKDELEANGIRYAILGIAIKKTHKEIRLKIKQGV